MSIKETITNKLIPQLVRDNVLVGEKVLNSKKYKIKSCVVNRLAGEDGTFMLAILHRVQLTLIDVEEVGETHSFDLVIKMTPSLPEDLIEQYGFKKLFNNEILAYTKILPLLTQLDDRRSVGPYPKFHYGHVRPTECAMVLGDFGPDGWRMAKTVVNLSLEHILLAVRYLGKFHGMCYAMKEMRNAQFREIVNQLSKTRFEEDLSSTNYVWDQITKLGPQRGLNALKNSELKDEIDVGFLATLEKMLESPSALQKELVQPVEPLAIICHGDYLRNNIAFKYSEAEDGHPIDAMMFDFQTMCYSSPMMDLVTFMANSTGWRVRQPNFEAIFAAYHQEVITNLCAKWGNKQEADLPPHYSYQSFLREYHRLLPFGYSVAASFISILHEPILDMDPFNSGIPEEEQINDSLTRGGEIVDQELRALLLDLYHLHKNFC